MILLYLGPVGLEPVQGGGEVEEGGGGEQVEGGQDTPARGGAAPGF